ncbi:MAG: hypothetical protein AAFR61_26280 [Bacteroidota bacterium]
MLFSSLRKHLPLSPRLHFVEPSLALPEVKKADKEAVAESYLFEAEHWKLKPRCKYLYFGNRMVRVYLLDLEVKEPAVPLEEVSKAGLLFRHVELEAPFYLYMFFKRIKLKAAAGAELVLPGHPPYKLLPGLYEVEVLPRPLKKRWD